VVGVGGVGGGGVSGRGVRGRGGSGVCGVGGWEGGELERRGLLCTKGDKALEVPRVNPEGGLGLVVRGWGAPVHERRPRNLS